MKWAHDGGLPDCPLKPAQFGNEGNGLEATRDIKSGELLLSIPETLVMSTVSAKRCRFLGPFLSATDLNSSMALALHVLVEAHRADSFWQPYLKTLPSR
jgi:histone-lysine N-methyltransferase SETD3